MATLTRCDQCGQTDDHPKVHMGDGLNGSTPITSRHLDCLSADDAQGLRDDPNVGHLRAAAIDAALTGTHGDDLRALLVEQATEEAQIQAGVTAPTGPDTTDPASTGDDH